MLYKDKPNVSKSSWWRAKWCTDKRQKQKTKDSLHQQAYSIYQTWQSPVHLAPNNICPPLSLIGRTERTPFRKKKKKVNEINDKRTEVAFCLEASSSDRQKLKNNSQQTGYLTADILIIKVGKSQV